MVGLDDGDGAAVRGGHDGRVGHVGVPRDDGVDVAVVDGRPVGWVCTRLHPEDRMGEVYIVVVDPDYQRRGIGRALMNHSMERARAAGMAMVMVETGGDLGHAPARATYEGLGFQRWPVARYFKDLADGD